MLLIFGLGYTGRAVASLAGASGFAVRGTLRDAAGEDAVAFDAAEAPLTAATHLLSTVPPDAEGDPVLARYGAAIAKAPRLRWIGYLSSTVVYGDRAGGWVDEDTPPAPTQERGHRRLAAEQAWSRFAGTCAVDVFRLAGIYGPGRSALDELRAGRARRIARPGHAFGRIHRDDIARAVLAAMRQTRGNEVRILNLNDDEPAETSAVIAEAAAILGVPAPAELPFDQAFAGMSAMARSFWSESRRVSSRKTQAVLGLSWLYPSYREGLRAILREQGSNDPV